MNTFVWILAGAALAWLTFSLLGYNRGRGLVVALLIGTLGAYFGGSILAPLMGHSAGGSTEFMPVALVVAAATATALLYIGEMLHDRYGI